MKTKNNLLLTTNQVRGLVNRKRKSMGLPPMKYQTFLSNWKLAYSNHKGYKYGTTKCWLLPTETVGPNYVFGKRATSTIITALCSTPTNVRRKVSRAIIIKKRISTKTRLMISL